MSNRTDYPNMSSVDAIDVFTKTSVGVNRGSKGSGDAPSDGSSQGTVRSSNDEVVSSTADAVG